MGELQFGSLYKSCFLPSPAFLLRFSPGDELHPFSFHRPCKVLWLCLWQPWRDPCTAVPELEGCRIDAAGMGANTAAPGFPGYWETGTAGGNWVPSASASLPPKARGNNWKREV